MPRRSSSGDAPMIWEAAVGSIVEPISASVALARDHVGLVEEPQSPVAAQHVPRGFEVAPVAHDFAQALILDLRDINRGVPRGEQGRGADRVADFLVQRVHLIAEYRSVVGVGVEIEVAAVVSFFFLRIRRPPRSILFPYTTLFRHLPDRGLLPRPVRAPLNPRRELLLRCWYRSEEHTSELQSRFDLVCRLLLEK